MSSPSDGCEPARTPAATSQDSKVTRSPLRTDESLPRPSRDGQSGLGIRNSSGLRPHTRRSWMR